jgi:hypothetical protein
MNSALSMVWDRGGVILAAIERATVSPGLVTEHLDRVLQSDVFRAAGRSSTLLRFLVEQTLNGHAERLKD